VGAVSSISNLRTHCAMVTGTHITWYLVTPVHCCWFCCSFTFCDYKRNQSSSVSIETRLQAGLPRFSSQQEQWWNFFSSCPCAGWLWSPPSLLSSGYQGLLSWGKVMVHEAVHWPPSSAKVKNVWSCTFHSPNTPLQPYGIVLNEARDTPSWHCA
jgi:hypothetical protein